MPEVKRRNDPAPTRFQFRLRRFALRRWPKLVLRFAILPLGLAGLAALAVDRFDLIKRSDQFAQTVHAALIERPEFAVTAMEIIGGAPDLRAQVRLALGVQTPVSSLTLDLDDLRFEVEAIARVAEARVAITTGSVLQIQLRERKPVALWRLEDRLHVIDRDGVVIGAVSARADRPDLPLVIGPGAERAVREAVRLDRRAGPVRDRLRGFVRVGLRRWDVALTGPAEGGVAVMLPEQGAEAAFLRALALHYAEEILDRGVTSVDLRDPRRPTLRLTPEAVGDLRRLRSLTVSEDA